MLLHAQIRILLNYHIHPDTFSNIAHFFLKKQL